MKGIIFDIQRFAVHDGPGIRSTVFLKGCGARCGWCHNPESQSTRPALQYYKDRCINCGKCVYLCPNRAHIISEEVKDKNSHTFDRSKCTVCGLCADECFSNALVISGREVNLEDVLRQVMDDKIYYEESGGGVTLSGGEPVLQNDFCEALLCRLKGEGVHTNLETAGFYHFHKIERLLPYLDLIMYDIKGISPNIYQSYIHADETIAIDNLKRLDNYGIPIIVRTPCVKGVNDNADEIEGIARMLSSLKNLSYYSLIRYHGLAKIKYDILGQEFTVYEAPSKEHIKTLENLAAQYVFVKRNEEQ